MTQKNETAVAKYKVPAIPDSNSGSAIRGLEGVTRDMIVVPRVKIVQPTSGEVEEYEIKAGTMINSLTKEVLADKETELEFLPLGMITTNRIYFRDMAEGGGLMCRSSDGKTGVGTPGGLCAKCKLSQWTEDEKTGASYSPRCTVFRNVVIWPLVENNEMPIVFSFARTTFPVGTQLINLMINKAAEPWKFKYSIKTKYVADDKGKYYVLVLKPAGKAPQELIKPLSDFYDYYSNLTYEVDGLDEEESSHQEQEAEVQDSKDEKSPF